MTDHKGRISDNKCCTADHKSQIADHKSRIFREKKYRELRRQIRECRACEELFGYEPRPILFGNADARIMQISQAPSRRVHETGKPFNDASGQKLRHDWYGITDEEFYNPDFFYIVSVAHCFPGKASGGGDRKPPKICAGKWLLQEMELVNNEIYILVGKYAADFFFPKSNFTDLIFEDQRLNGKPAYVLPHPSPLNVKWFLDHPAFEEKRIKEIRYEIHRILNK